MKSKIIFNVRFVLLALAINLSLCVSAFAQEITGSIVGTVKDSAGAAVAGATVTAVDTAKGITVRTVVTNNDGEFSFPLLQPNIYSVTVEAANFKKSKSNNIKVDVGQRRSVDVSLEAGKIEETVTVEADAVSIDSTSATNGTVINGDQAREIPINNRNFVQLITLAPGVSNDLADQVYVGTTNPDGQANTVNVSVNGSRSSTNTFTVDGADVTDRGSNLTIQAYPSVDSIGEFRVLRSLYPAESGRSGGGQINVVTRSGGRKFSGSAFAFARNEAFNANNFLTNSITIRPPFGRNNDPGRNGDNNKARRAPFRYYNYGWTIGGPVSFLNFGELDPSAPSIRKYPRTFFFFSQELRRDRRFTAPAATTVPDSLLLDGRFPIYVCVNRVYLNETCTGTNVLGPNSPINPALINPAALGYLNGIYKKLPLPNTRTANNPYGLTAQIPNEADFRQEILKIDHSFNDKLSMYYRYQQDKIPTLDGNALFSSGSSLPGVSTTKTNSPGRTHTFQTTYVASPKLIFEGRYNYGYGAILSENVGTLALKNTNVPITLPYANQRDRVPTLTGNGFTGLTSFGPYDNFSYKQNFGGSVTFLTGNHSFKAGGTYSIYRKNENALAGNNEGSISAFSPTLPTVLPVGATQPTSFTLPDGTVVPITTALSQNLQRWASFLVGNATAFSQAKFDYTADLRQKTIEGFIQDEWKITSNATVSIGVRYSYFGAPYDKNGRLSNFLPELFNAAQAPLVTGVGSRVVDPAKNFCSGLIVNSQNYATAPNNCTPTISPFGKYVIDVSKKDFAPRVGLAWDPFKTGKTSVRMGYGIYHEQVLNGTFLQNIGANPPYQETATASATQLNNPASNAGISIITTSQSLRAVQSNWKTPYIQHWSLDWQQQLTSKTVVTVGYYGSKAVHLQGLTELNSLRPGKALASQCAPGNNYFGQVAAFTAVPCQLPGYAFRGAANAAITGNTNVVGTNLFTDTLILDQLRPYQGYRSIAIVQPKYNSNYHSLQLSAQHRFTGSSQVNAFYTWSKNLTDSINDRTTSPQNAYDLAGEYQLAAFDRRHILSINYIYELPFFKTQQGFIGKVLGGWQASGIVTYNTGLPFTATTSGFDPAGLGIINTNPAARPNLLCNPNSGVTSTAQQFFNIACFQTNSNLLDATGLNRILVPNTVGNTARGNITGPKTTRFDLTLVKNLKFGEKLRIQLRAEGFNIFNKVNFRALSTNVTAFNFGAVTTTRDPRTMQFGAKFNF
jgi:Carboxypeptidase regulatory-like domain